MTNRTWLNNCRVLHLAANRVGMKDEVGVDQKIQQGVPLSQQQSPNATPFAAFALPQYYNSEGNATNDTRSQLTAADLISQVRTFIGVLEKRRELGSYRAVWAIALLLYTGAV